MIVVDSSVWIGHFRNSDRAAVATLRAIADVDFIVVGDLVLVVSDLVLLEVLQGARDKHHADTIKRHLRSFDVRTMLDEQQAMAAARNFRSLRAIRITVRKTIDLVIATFCLTGGHLLLHDDQDFDLMASPLGLLIY